MEFQCNFKTIFSRAALGSVYRCSVKKILRSSTLQKTIIITGKHEANQSNNDVTDFIIGSVLLDELPKNVFKDFPKLRHVKIDRCGLKKISREDLVGLENLETLQVVNNNLTFLPDDLFADMKRLRRIDFSNNRLERLSSKLLTPVKFSLRRADFKENTCIDDCFVENEADKEFGQLLSVMDSLEPPPPKMTSFVFPAFPFEPIEIKNNDLKCKRHQQMNGKLTEFKASGEFSDFTIKVREKEFKVHKNILAAQSPVFRQMFTNDDAENEKNFNNFGEESFESFLNFFYSGEVDEGANAMKVFEFAMVFDVEFLKTMCLNKISASLSPENALEVFELGHTHCQDMLKRNAFRAIQKLIPDMPGHIKNDPEKVNKIVSAKRHFDALLGAAKNEAPVPKDQFNLGKFPKFKFEFKKPEPAPSGSVETRGISSLPEADPSNSRQHDQELIKSSLNVLNWK